jgi:hypothetical protein
MAGLLPYLGHNVQSAGWPQPRPDTFGPHLRMARPNNVTLSIQEAYSSVPVWPVSCWAGGWVCGSVVCGSVVWGCVAGGSVV